MRAGNLDRRVTILRVSASTPDGHGGVTLTWAEVATVWAEVRPQNGTERWRSENAEVAAVATHRFRIRWGQAVTVLDRLRFGGRDWEIIRVDEIGRREGQLIQAMARAE